MPKNQYVEKPHKVLAEPYSADPNDPEPADVCHCMFNPMGWTDGRAHVHTTRGMVALEPGDWIVQDPWTLSDLEVMAADEFEARYGHGNTGDLTPA
jgi:hypothetical protein